LKTVCAPDRAKHATPDATYSAASGLGELCFHGCDAAGKCGVEVVVFDRSERMQQSKKAYPWEHALHPSVQIRLAPVFDSPLIPVSMLSRLSDCCGCAPANYNCEVSLLEGFLRMSMRLLSALISDTTVPPQPQ